MKLQSLRIVTWALMYMAFVLCMKSFGVPLEIYRLSSPHQFEDVDFTIVPLAFGAPYRSIQKSTNDPLYVFFQAEPISIELRLINRTKLPVPISSPTSRWLDLVSWNIYKDNIELDNKKFKMVNLSAETKIDSTGATVAKTNKAMELSTIGSGEGVKIELGFTQADGSGLKSGVYKVRLTLTPKSLGSRFPMANRQIPAEVVFGVKEVITKNDRLNYYSNLAERHRRSKEYGRALEFISKMLELNQNSTPAFNTLGWIYFDQGKTNQAVEAINKAIRIIEMNLDPEYISSQEKRTRDESVAHLKQLINLFRRNPR